MQPALDHPASTPYCSMPSPPTDIEVTRRDDGTLILRSRIMLAGVSGTICAYLPHWAQETPDRVFLAQRTRDNAWQSISYGEFWSRVRSVGQALIDRGGAAGDTLAILSGNSIENAVIQFAAMSIGLQVRRSRQATVFCQVASAASKTSRRSSRRSLCLPRRRIPSCKPVPSPALRRPNG